MPDETVVSKVPTVDDAAEILETEPSNSDRRRRPRIVFGPVLGLLGMWAIIFVYFALSQPQFLTGANLKNIVEENSIVFVVAIAETAIVLMGGIDLSSGGLLALTSLILVAGNHGAPEWVAVVLTILGAGVAGLVINGIPVGYFRMNPFVVTLGSATIFRGLANVLTTGNTYILNKTTITSAISGNNVGPVPAAAVVMVVVAVAYYVVLRWTFFGRDLYAIGGNEEAAKLAGIRVRRVKAIAYLSVGLVVGLAAVMEAGRLGSVAPSAGSGLELLAVAAVLLGGTSLSGGRGSVVGTAIAVLFLATIDNGLRISGVSSFWQDVVTGAILILAVGFEQLRQWLVRNPRALRAFATTIGRRGKA